MRKGKLDKSSRRLRGELISEFCGELVLLRHPLLNRTSMLLLLPLLFMELLGHGASIVGKKNPGGKISVVGHSKVEKKFWGRPGSTE